MNIENLLGETRYNEVSCELVIYECEYHQLKEASFLLELVLWKSKINESTHCNNQFEDAAADGRGECIINCGAGITIPNVLPFLTSE